jgi:hypothetical protein
MRRLSAIALRSPTQAGVSGSESRSLMPARKGSDLAGRMESSCHSRRAPVAVFLYKPHDGVVT